MANSERNVLRVLSWNIGGHLSTMHLSTEILKLWEHVDLLIFSHTGRSASDVVPELPGFVCVSCNARTYDARSGGVAVFARQSL